MASENRESEQEEIVKQTFVFLLSGYDYLWLKTMLKMGKHTKIPGSTLIVGNSYGLNDIWEPAWHNAVNCSMHSQDLYYDYCCVRHVLEENNNFCRCLIVLGYYTAYQDVSRGKNWSRYLMESVYMPLFKDVHNCRELLNAPQWDFINQLPRERAQKLERGGMGYFRSVGCYYNRIKKRAPWHAEYPSWDRLTPERRGEEADCRCAEHNHVYTYQASRVENRELLEEMVDYICSRGVQPVIVIPPFTREYNERLLPQIREDMLEMIEVVRGKAAFTDFNELPQLFTPEDFMDTDHMSFSGAVKVSTLLTTLYGK